MLETPAEPLSGKRAAFDRPRTPGGDIVVVAVPWDGHSELLASLASALAGNVSAVLLDNPTVAKVDTDVLVLGDVREATDLALALADTIHGVRGVFGGRLRNAHQVEAFTADLISVNRRYKAHSGLRVTDV